MAREKEKANADGFGFYPYNVTDTQFYSPGESGGSLSLCTFSRKLQENQMNDLKLTDNIKFITGFNIWPDRLADS